MTYVGHALIDWDDTVAFNIRYFDAAEQALADLIATRLGLDVQAVQERGRQLDLETAQRMGLVPESFLTAWTTCYRRFCAEVGVPEDPETLTQIRRHCAYPYEVDQELIPGAVEALHWLRDRGFELVLWTAGRRETQLRKVERAGLSHLFHAASVVSEKNAALLARTLSHRPRDRALVVGNSLRSDVAPALALGLTAVHVRGASWAYDHASVDPVDMDPMRYVPVGALAEVPAALQARLLYPPAAGDADR